jgi:GT2 family glycosyltransferase
MNTPMVTVAVPTLQAGGALAACLRSLERQTFRRFEVVVVDNSGARKAAEVGRGACRVIFSESNVGFGAAINRVFRETKAPYLATLNDDASAEPEWLSAMVEAAETNPGAGMFASRVMLGTGMLDSAGMLLAADGSSKQRGHGQAAEGFSAKTQAFFPSGSAALYRRAMFDQIGLFDESFFLYCEDTDLGLRARWAGWECVYVPRAAVEHRYSHTAGSASPLKAYYVERNRCCMVVKNFPAGLLLVAPFASLVRYFWHAVFLAGGVGKAGEYREAGHDAWMLPFLVLRAHLAAAIRLPGLLKARKQIAAQRKITRAEFRALAKAHAISLREIASL